jgi:hypothetical protein
MKLDSASRSKKKRAAPVAEKAAPRVQRRRLCLNCDNRHGCRTAAPLCLRIAREEGEDTLSGRELLAKHDRLDACPTCGLFRQCWSDATYRRARGHSQLPT